MGCLGSGGRADAIPSSADGEYGSAERADQQPTEQKPRQQDHVRSRSRDPGAV
jgi:hypothetical protein